MTRIVFLLISIFLATQLSAQFSRVEVNTGNVTHRANTKAAGDNDFVVEIEGELYHITYSDINGFQVQWIENSIIDIYDIEMHDIDQDGDLDIMCYQRNDGGFHIYLKDNGVYTYAPELTINYSSPHFLHAQDFNDDGIEDLMINHGIFVTTGINERTRVLRYPVSNTYYYDLVHFMDHDQDGDKDILFHQVNRLWVLDNLGTDVSAASINISETNNLTAWCRVIKTTEGERIFYYDRGTDSIRELSFANGSYELRSVLGIELDHNNSEAEVFDLDGDGNEEIIINSYNDREIHIFKYDPVADSGSVTTIDLDQLVYAFGVLEIAGEPMLYVGHAETHRAFRFNAMLQPELYSSSVTAIKGRDNGFKDFDGDGNVDVISGIRIKRYLGDGAFSNIEEFSFPSTGGTLEDYDDDGDLDYVKEYEWYENTGNFSWGPATEIPDTDPTPDPDIFFTAELIRSDIDEDGDIDILTYNYFGEPLELLENIDNDYFEDPVTLTTSEYIGGDVVLIEILDMDGDSNLDILMAAHSGMILMKGHGDLTFDTPILLYSGNNKPLSGEVADLNSDGFPDVLLGTRNIIAGSSLGEAILYVGNDDVPDARLIRAGSGYHRAAFGNFDQTGWLDIMYQNADGIYWASINPDFTFNSRLVDQSFLSNGRVLVRDVNSDGDDDLILYHDNDLDIFYYLNGESLVSASGCPEHGIYVRNKTQVERFRKLYGTCPTINGHLFIGRGDRDWSDIDDLSAFSSVTCIAGDLHLNLNNLLDNLHGLDSLAHIGGSLIINGYKSNSLDGIEKLRYVGGDFDLRNVGTGSSGFADLSAFERLDTILGNFSIDRSDIATISPLIQDTFYGDFQLSYTGSFFETELFDSIRSIKGSLTIENTNIQTLEALGGLRELGGLRIYSNAYLQKLGVARSIDQMQGSIYISENQSLTLDSGLDSVRTVAGDVYIKDNVCRIMKNLQSVGGKLTLISQVVDEGSFAHLESIGNGLSILTNTAEDFHQFSHLTNLRGLLNITNNQATSLYGFHNLRDTVSAFILASNRVLRTMEHLHEDLAVTGTWRISGNSELHYCDVIPLCNHIARGGLTDIYNNGLDCNDISDVRCLDNAFSGFVYYDFNEDAVRDPNEALLANVQIILSNRADTTLTSSNGYYATYLHAGDALEVQMITPQDWQATSDDRIELDSFIMGDPSNYGNDFGLVPTFVKRDFGIHYNQGTFVCNRAFNLQINVQNNGTFAESGDLVVHYPAFVNVDTGFDEYIVHDTVNNVLRIAIDTLFPFFSHVVDIPFIAPGADHLDKEFVTTVELFRQGTELVESQEFKTALLCSFDPNDKLVRSTNGGVNIHVDSDDALVYTVRFQNTGNYFAEDVRIVDTLSANLDMASLKFIASSHPVEVRTQGNVVYFNFYDINLPDSLMDYTGSQGYVMFEIRPLEGLSLGEEIDNDADIYFDYNDPILTNLVKSSIVDLTFVVDPSFEGSIGLFPNPAADRVMVTIDDLAVDNELKYRVLSISGALVQSGATRHSTIDLNRLLPGLYFLHLSDEGTSYGVHKVVKAGK